MDVPGGEFASFLTALLLTCVIEVPFYLLAFGMLGWIGRPRPAASGLASPALTGRTAPALALAVNLITHPVLWHAALGFSDPMVLLFAEAAVAVVEGLIIFGVVVVRRHPDSVANRLGWSLLTAAAVNALSLTVGLLINAG